MNSFLSSAQDGDMLYGALGVSVGRSGRFAEEENLFIKISSSPFGL
jgi:hypothetical protein